MNKKTFERRIDSLKNQLKKEKQYLFIFTINEMVKNGDINQVVNFINTNYQKDKKRYFSGEIKGTTTLKPRFKFYICREDIIDTISKDELEKLTILKMRKKWKNWVNNYHPEFNLSETDFHRFYVNNIEYRYTKDMFNMIDL